MKQFLHIYVFYKTYRRFLVEYFLSVSECIAVAADADIADTAVAADADADAVAVAMFFVYIVVEADRLVADAVVDAAADMRVADVAAVAVADMCVAVSVRYRVNTGLLCIDAKHPVLRNSNIVVPSSYFLNIIYILL